MNASPLFVATYELLNFVLAVPVDVVVAAKVGVHDFGLFEFEHDLIEAPHQAARVVADRVQPRLVGEALPVADVQNKCDVVAATLWVQGRKGFMGVRPQNLAVLQLDQHQHPPNVVNKFVRVFASVGLRVINFLCLEDSL